MADPLTTLQGDLNVLAAPETTNPSGGNATPTTALTTAGEVLSLLADTSLVGNSIGTTVNGVYTAIATAITNDAVSSLKAIAGELGNIPQAGNAAAALLALQNVLQTAQSLIPGGSSALASAFASTSQFATLFGNLLQDPATAANTLYEIAQQLEAVANAFKTAAAGNP
jgi:hypothetical protein